MANLNFLARAIAPCPLAAEFREPVSNCRVCGRDVLDLSVYTREEAARLLSTKEPPCVRFALRDGVPVFRDSLPKLREALVTLGIGAGVALAVQTVRTAAGMDPPVLPTIAHHEPIVAGRITMPIHAPPPTLRQPPAQDFSIVGGAPPPLNWK